MDFSKLDEKRDFLLNQSIPEARTKLKMQSKCLNLLYERGEFAFPMKKKIAFPVQKNLHSQC